MFTLVQRENTLPGIIVRQREFQFNFGELVRVTSKGSGEVGVEDCERGNS